MKVELWGTYSVKDHLPARAFVADVLVYDRLVIPRPPKPGEDLAPDEEVGTQRWEREGWYPQRLTKMLEILGEEDLAVEIPWGKQAIEMWRQLMTAPETLGANRSEMMSALSNHLKYAPPNEAAYLGTGGLLQMVVANQVQFDVARKLVALGRPADAEVEPVIAYRSCATLQQEQQVRQEPVAGSPSYALFGWDFYVPEDSGKTDYELLREAIKLARRSDFREVRQTFHGWLKQMYQGGVDPHDAQARMLKLLAEYRGFTRGAEFRTALQYAAKVVEIAAPLAGLLGDTKAKEIGVLTGVAMKGATLAMDRFWAKPGTSTRSLPAAFVYESRKFFSRSLDD